MNKVQVHVDSLEDMGKRFISAWKRAEAAEHVDEQHVTFFNLEVLLETLSPKRLALLRVCAGPLIHPSPPWHGTWEGITSGSMRMWTPWSRPGCWCATIRAFIPNSMNCTPHRAWSDAGLR